ncbi:NifU family protein [Peredibacter sp. HCB2-198]|uniref:NifU family protein n=1 Tax=Peredibacter sp. HCB2-198 TaxID=3383025 RepID=UPI0038B569CA
MSQQALEIIVQPTPNPNALKFILDKDVKTEGKVSFKTPQDCKDVPLAAALFDLRGVDQIHFFQNVITISKFSFEEWDSLEPAVQTCIESFLEDHDPNFKVYDPEAERLANLSPELRSIEEILNKRIRPGLQGDGGDIAVKDYKDNVLIVKYQGACGTCPSSTTGTLEAIRSILRDEFNPDIEVYLAPEV